MVTVRTAGEMARFAGGVFVPTMGALHQGHASLIHQAAAMAKGAGSPVAVSIFVNPTQFNDPADLARYPRTPEADAALCAAAGCDVLFTPAVGEVYPAATQPRQPALPAAATGPGLEDACRPGHFAGVCQVVARLFEIVHPRAAVFGEKDWQQLCVIRQMTAAERLPIDIIPGPTVREADGLAMSSRNRFLSPTDRQRAAALWRALTAARAEATVPAAEAAMRRSLRDTGLSIEYAVVRDAATLMPLPDGANGGRALIAARLGSVRLIDNAPWGIL